jgi:RimJ/RimL family protein N-acetyltransferase
MILGPKIGLRAIEAKDLEDLKNWRNLEEFRKNFREHRELNTYNQEVWLAKLNSSSNDYMFAIIRLEDQKLIGACGLLYVNWIIRSADFSFYIGLDKLYIDDIGYAQEATNLLLNYGFNNLNLNKVWMELYEFDSKKIDFFTNKFKFKTDGILRENCFFNRKYWDSHIISLLKHDFFDTK